MKIFGKSMFFTGKSTKYRGVNKLFMPRLLIFKR